MKLRKEFITGVLTNMVIVFQKNGFNFLGTMSGVILNYR